MIEHSEPVEPGAAARALVKDGRQMLEAIEAAVSAPVATRRAARDAYESLRGDVARRELDKMPMDRLKEITQGRLRFGVIEKAGYRTVGQILTAPALVLQRIPGVGPQTAAQVVAAAAQMRTALEEKTRVRIDPDDRTPSQTALVTALRGYEVARSVVPPKGPDLAPLTAEIAGRLEPATLASSRMRMFFTWPGRKKQESRDALASLAAILRSPEAVAARERLTAAVRGLSPDPNWVWNDYLARPVFYNGLLIIGDEMGLGKTVQALAAICHLAADGATHFLVVCPASVVVNWTREVPQHTRLDAYRLHGPELERNRRAWTAKGGVAVTTYGALRTMNLPPDITLGMVVVDEAHYAKNPNAQRTKAVSQLSAENRRVVFLTGTPMENRVEEFRVLVGHLQPGAASRVRSPDGVQDSTMFRKAIASVYLRRNQDDVLNELPPRLETQEWVELAGPALAAYREEVFAGNFMGMRRAAFAPGTVDGSAKLQRLVEIVAEAAASGRKAVIFSFFRDVLAATARVLGTQVPEARVLGPLTGSVPPSVRQEMVDEFTAVSGPAVLVAQIQAGGVGLNVQAASVVIIAEPQWTPSTEEQAIARAHRMGQVRRVDVHRLLCENSVDQRMLEVLHGKRVAFDQYGRRSDLAEATPDAMDISDLTEAGKAAAETELQRRMVEAEQRRLRAEYG